VKFNFFSVQSLCSLCLCGGFCGRLSTTETQRTQMLHRGEQAESLGRKNKG